MSSMAVLTRQGKRPGLSTESVVFTRKEESRRTREDSCGSSFFEMYQRRARRRVSGSTSTTIRPIRDRVGICWKGVYARENVLMIVPAERLSRTSTFTRTRSEVSSGVREVRCKWSCFKSQSRPGRLRVEKVTDRRKNFV